MTIHERAGELSWLCDELTRELEVLEAGGNPVIHRFLSLNLTNGIVKQATAIKQELEATNQASSSETEKEKAS